MIADDVHPDAAALLQQLSDVLDELSALPLDTFGDEQVVGTLRELETQRRRLAPVDHALIAQASQRHLASVHGCKSTAVLLRNLLRVGAGEASARVKAAEALGPRRSFTGEALDPIYPTIAAAQAAGTVNPDVARVIIGMIEKLPDPVRCVEDTACEQFLTEQAAVLDVDAVTLVARRLALTLDPDGQLKDAKYRDDHRDLRLRAGRVGVPPPMKA